MEIPAAGQPARIAQPKDPSADLNSTGDLVPQQVPYFNVLASSSDPPMQNPVLARQTVHNGKPAVIFKWTDYYGIMSEECKWTLVGKFTMGRPRIEEIRSKFLEQTPLKGKADVCHAYQLLKQGGLKDENIIVFMYDDIAYNKENPRPGVIINSPHGENVYEGVAKDYTGEHCNADNFFAVILGNKTALTGGSGKVVNSGPNDHIFIYYADHGAPGMISMPNDMIFADDLIKVLTTKNLDEAYRKLVFYLEACESGSMFDGLLPKGLNIYVTTASNPYESSWATYCSADGDEGCVGECPPEDFKDVCLGDLYSVSWLEDSDLHNRQVETLEQQYQVVRKRTLNNNTQEGSHVMQYGDLHLSKDVLFGYMGSNSSTNNHHESRPSSKMINQRDVHLWYLRSKFQSAPEGSARKNEASRQLIEAIAQRQHVDDSVRHIGELLFGVEKGQEVLKTIRPAGQSLVDDWDCLKSFVKTYEAHCGKLTPYGRKHVRGFANLCNAGIQREQMDAAAKQGCAL